MILYSRTCSVGYNETEEWYISRFRLTWLQYVSTLFLNFLPFLRRSDIGWPGIRGVAIVTFLIVFQDVV